MLLYLGTENAFYMYAPLDDPTAGTTAQFSPAINEIQLQR
jgi:hypothetical protein